MYLLALEDKIEQAKKQLVEVERKRDKARTKGTAEMYRCMYIRLDERIKVYEELLKGE